MAGNNNKEQQKRVLFFDDETPISGALAKNLVLYDWDVTFVSEIDILFKELKSRQFDIIILDIMAPVPNKTNDYVNFTQKELDEMGEIGINTGVVLAKKIWEYKNVVPILFISARQKPDTLDQFKHGGHKFSYIRKAPLAKDVSDMLNLLLFSSDNNI